MLDKKTKSESIVNNPSKHPPFMVTKAREYLAKEKAKKQQRKRRRNNSAAGSAPTPSARSNREAMLAQAFTPKLV